MHAMTLLFSAQRSKGILPDYHARVRASLCARLAFPETACTLGGIHLPQLLRRWSTAASVDNRAIFDNVSIGKLEPIPSQRLSVPDMLLSCRKV